MFASLYPLIKPCLFSLDAERAHEWTLSALAGNPSLIGKAMGNKSPTAAELSGELFGLKIKSPVGLAAGRRDEACVRVLPS